MTTNILKFETYKGRTSSRKSIYKSDKMRGLIENAIKNINERNEKKDKLNTQLETEKDKDKANKLRVKIAELSLPISIPLYTLETYFGIDISNSDNFRWSIDPKNKHSHFKDLIAEHIKDKMHIGAQLGKCKDKSKMSINFRFI